MDALGLISAQMAACVPYQYGEWTTKVKYPYYVGELIEEPPTTEDGLCQYSFILTGFCRGKESIATFERDKKTLRGHFSPIFGLSGETDDGVVIIFYDNAFYVPAGEAELYKIQINFTIKEWKGV
jgi:hypothetical protein